MVYYIGSPALLPPFRMVGVSALASHCRVNGEDSPDLAHGGRKWLHMLPLPLPPAEGKSLFEPKWADASIGNHSPGDFLRCSHWPESPPNAQTPHTHCPPTETPHPHSASALHLPVRPLILSLLLHPTSHPDPALLSCSSAVPLGTLNPLIFGSTSKPGGTYKITSSGTPAELFLPVGSPELLSSFPSHCEAGMREESEVSQ